jgi:cytosol alanyl aminopeptidase
VLASAALQGDAALFDAYAAALKTSTDRQERSQLWHALGHYRVPALAERARELLLEPGLDPREGLETLLRAQTADAADRRAALDFIARYQGGLARRMDRQAPARWPELFDRACGDDDAQRLRHDLGPTAARHPGGRATLAAVLESAALCGAWRAHHGPLPVVD